MKSFIFFVTNFGENSFRFGQLMMWKFYFASSQSSFALGGQIYFVADKIFCFKLN
jgi:hypothetical protein